MPTQKRRSTSRNTVSKVSQARASQRKAAAADTNRTIQWIGIGVVVLVIAAIVISVLANRQPATPTPTAQPTQAAASGDVPVLIGTKTYDKAPPMLIDVSKDYTATVKMQKGGEFVIQLFPDKAPLTVNSFVFLARQGYFDGVTFHRVLEGFMAQGGDPSGTGGGGPGYEFQNEDSDLTFDKAGVVAMANAGRDTNGSQFFITFTPQERLTGDYTIFGQVTSGLEVVEALTRRNPDDNPTFSGDAIETITITGE